MKYIPVSLKENRYKIAVGSRILPKLGAALKLLDIGDDAVIITNRLINRLHGKAVISGLRAKGFSVKVFEVPDGEKSKSMKHAFDLIQKVARYDVKKKLFIVAMGGGVVGDLAGYVAAAYRRGIPYVQVPTTLLAQVDSAIGGKVGIDLSVGKNLVGAFYQPKLVFSDVAVLSTLSPRQVRNGLAEVVKYGVISNSKLFDYIERNYDKLLAHEPGALTKVVVECSKIKAGVVLRDERDTKDLRAILNFGHTFGHAIEAASRYDSYHHGEAVALGMQMAADLSHRLGFLSKKSVFRLKKIISDIGLPFRVKGVGVLRILKAMEHDKKFQGKKKRFVVATKIGHVKIIENVPTGVVVKAIREFL